MMKDSLILGMIFGTMIGVILMETCQPLQNAVQQGKQKLKQTIAKI